MSRDESTMRADVQPTGDVSNPQAVQHEYYTKTAATYDEMRGGDEWALHFAESLLLGVVVYIEAESLLDVGAGTGRTIAFLKSKWPKLRFVGIEPVAALRRIAVERRKLAEEEIVAGDGANLPFSDGSFDLVVALGVLHHVPQPSRVVHEMLRVSRKGVFICDVNHVGQGNWVARRVKGLLRRSGLWPIINVLRTGGKGYYVSDGDGLAYSYSVFENLAQIEQAGFRVHLMNMGGHGVQPFYDSPGAVVIALRERSHSTGV